MKGTSVLFLAAVLLSAARLHSQNQTLARSDSGTPFRIHYVDGNPVEIFEDSHLWIDVFPPEPQGKGVFIVRMAIGNKGPSEIDVNPSLFSATADDAPSSKLGWMDGDAVIAKREKAARKRERIGAGLAGFGAGMQTQTATVNSSDGSTSTVTYHDPSATQAVQADAKANRDAIVQRYAALTANVLRRNTVEPGGRVLGSVYFSAPKGMKKKAQISTLSIVLGAAIYRFRWNGTVPAQ